MFADKCTEVTYVSFVVHSILIMMTFFANESVVP